MDKCDYDFVLMAKGMISFVRVLILENKGEFENSREYNIRQYKTYGMTVKKQLYASIQRKDISILKLIKGMELFFLRAKEQM